MKAARVEKLISAIDIGSSKVSALIAGLTDSGELLVLGTGQRESRGVTRGCIADVEQAELSVRHAVEQGHDQGLLAHCRRDAIHGSVQVVGFA